MAKPQIIGALRVNGATYTAGQETELARVLSSQDAARHIENGVLAGDWEFGADVPEFSPQTDSEIEKLREKNAGLVFSLSESEKKASNLRAEFEINVVKLANERDAARAELETQTELVAQLSAKNDELQSENERLRVAIEKAHETPIADNEFGATLRKIVSAPVASVLIKSGFDSAEKIAAASDKELEDLDGVATGSIEKLRAQFGANADGAKGE